MAQSVIGALRVVLGMDSAQFERGAKRAESTVQKLGTRMQTFGAAMSVVSTGIVLAMRGALNAADDAGKLAAKVGLSVEALTRLQYVAELSGVSMQSLQAGVTRLSRAMVDGNKQFSATGIAARDAAGNLRPTEDVLLDLADLFRSMPDGAEKTALAVGVLGRSGADLIPLLNGGRAAVKGLMDEADALGLTISTETFQAAEVFNDSITRIVAVFTGFTRQIAAELAPAMAAIADTIADVAVAFGSLSPQVRTGAAVLVALTAAIGPLALAIGTVIKSMAILQAGLAVVFGPAGLVIAGIAVAVVLAVKLVELVRATGGWGNALQLLGDVASGVWEGIKTSASSIGPALKAVWQDVRSGFLEMLEGITARWREFLLSLAGVASFLPGGDFLSGQLMSAASAADATVTGFARSANDAAVAAGNLRQQAAELAQGGFERAREAVGLLTAAVADTEEQASTATDAVSALGDEVEELGGAAGGGGGRGPIGRLGEEAEGATEAFGPLEGAVGTFSSALGDLFSGGVESFADFADTVFKGFQRLLADMIATAARNKILIALGVGGSAAGTAASAAGSAVTGSGGGIAGIAGALGPAGLAIAGGAAVLGGIFAARRRRREAKAARRAQLRAGFRDQEAQIAELNGDTEFVRERQLEGMTPYGKRLQREIFRLQDEKRIADEREGIERRLLELQGDTVELRKRELEALDPANRALAERAFALEDEARISNERRGLEERLLQLVGATDELRRREIEALDQSNRGLLQTIFNIEDMTARFEDLQRSLSARFDLSAKDFLTSFDARFAQATAARDLVRNPGGFAGDDPQLRQLVDALRKQSKILEDIQIFGIPGRA